MKTQVLAFLLIFPFINIFSQSKNKNQSNVDEILTSLTYIPYIVGDSLTGYPIIIKHTENYGSKCPALYKFFVDKKKYIGWKISNGKEETILSDIKYDQEHLNNQFLFLNGKSFNTIIKASSSRLLRETDTQIVFLVADNTIITINK